MRTFLKMDASWWPCALLALAACSVSQTVFAWIYPEHRDIAVLAVEGLDPQRQAAFDRLWQDARAGGDARLCRQGADPAQGTIPQCIDWAALSGIAGDHSCSSRKMLDAVLDSDWVLVVADVAAQLKVDLARIPITAAPEVTANEGGTVPVAREQLANEKHRAARVNALRTADIRLQRADPLYATRADANLAHFMLARPDTLLDPMEYGALALRPGSDLNAAGVYAWFHISALQKASRLADPRLSAAERAGWARAALFDEAFALHFLEDMYASGHVAGSWGDVSQRKGTHDFYNAAGLEVFTWKGRERTVVLMGDAHMRPADAQLAAAAVRTSLAQVLDAATGYPRGYTLPAAPDTLAQADDFDICLNPTFADRGIPLGARGKGPYAPALNEALLDTPVPGLGTGLGALPRSRSEVGAFIGLAGAVDSRYIDSGFVPSQDQGGWITGLDMGFRAGLGLEGAMGNSGDGLVFGQIGLRADTASTNEAEGTALENLGGSLSAAIPARGGLSARIRAPYYLIPGDLLFLSPMYLLDRERYMEMAVTAANGGLIPWQRGWATRFGRFQFVLGRELGVTLFGILGDTQLAAPGDLPIGPSRVVEYKSVYLDLPILEYRPYRAFSSNQSSSVVFQLFAGADLPYDESVKSPRGASQVNLDPIYSLGVRMVFDWRYYY
jgi:hypothetical protein